MLINGLRSVGVVVATFLVISVGAQDNAQLPSNTLTLATNEPSYDVERLEEIFVEGERPTGADMDLLEMDRVYRWKETAARSFKTGQYEKAFPQLLLLARMGFKDAQARVSYIYLHGLGGQKKSNLEAIGWLGVATTGETRPAYRNLFKQMMTQIPSEHLDSVSAHVQTYRDKYGADKMGIDCTRSRTGHVSKFLCRYSAEMDQNQVRMMMLQAGQELPWMLKI